MKRQTVASWLESHVDKRGHDECWPASGGGYNKPGWHVSFKASGQRYLAHRAAWVAANGPIADGLFVLHKCDNPKCCNPNHLFLGTQADNARDMWGKQRGVNASHLRRGVKTGPSPHRHLSENQVLTVFSRYLKGDTQRRIAADLGVTDVTVSNVLKGKMYPEFSAQRAQVAHLLGRGVKNRKAKASNANHHS